MVASVAGIGTGLWVPADAPREEMVSILADALREVLIEHTMRAVPKCPLHEHPLQPTVVSGRAMWQCPRFPPAGHCPIGQLAKCLRERTP